MANHVSFAIFDCGYIPVAAWERYIDDITAERDLEHNKTTPWSSVIETALARDWQAKLVWTQLNNHCDVVFPDQSRYMEFIMRYG